MGNIILNEDFENFMASRPPEKMTETGLREQIDFYTEGGMVSTIIFCGNGMRAMFDSHSFEPLWKDIEILSDGRVFFHGKEVTDKTLPVKSNVLNCKRLHENVKNPFSIRIAYARSRGCKVFAGMRMNDVHWASDNDFLMHSDFWRKYPEFRCASYRSSWNGQALDYAHPEVRNHFLSLAREYLERFDFDGIEFDWMRTPYHLRPGFELADGKYITQFMRDARKIADSAAEKHGHEVSISIRVPSAPDDARRNGFDIPRWKQEGLIDSMTVSNYYETTNYDPPLELWRMILGEDFRLAAALDINCRQYPGAKNSFRNTKEIIYGFVSSFLFRGADSIYLFNHMDGNKSCMYDRKQFENILKYAGSRSMVEKKKRRHIVTFTDSTACALGSPLKSRLPFRPRGFAAVRLNVGGGTSGRKAFVILAVNMVCDIEIRLNTFPCNLCSMPRHYEYPFQAIFLAWEIPGGALHDGDNVIEANTACTDEVTVEWCEILIN